jgi:hypothetical protein
MAAAPDLLEALKDACEEINRLRGQETKYRAIIAKAEGETP